MLIRFISSRCSYSSVFQSIGLLFLGAICLLGSYVSEKVTETQLCHFQMHLLFNH
ncbi:hypothetical protein FORC17_3955 [Vibrio vulnificus]|nr:hypothetical protein FORC17_3955 [Vibrio vulnificus]